MRSALLFATIAISTFAAPIAQSTDSNLNIHGCWRSGSKRSDQVDSRTPTPKSCKISHPRNVDGDEITLEARGAIRNPGSKRDAQPEPVIRGGRGNKRSGDDDEEEEETVEARAIRNQSSKREAGAIRGPRDNKQSDEDDEDVEARAIRNQSSKRNAEAQGRVRGKNTKREEETEYEDLELEDEVANKLDARLNRGSHPRSAEAEPAVTGPGAGGAHLCLKAGGWRQC